MPSDKIKLFNKHDSLPAFKEGRKEVCVLNRRMSQLNVAAQGHPIPFLRKGSREALREATGDTKLPALKLPDGTTVTHSRAILAWISRQR